MRTLVGHRNQNTRKPVRLTEMRLLFRSVSGYSPGCFYALTRPDIPISHKEFAKLKITRENKYSTATLV